MQISAAMQSIPGFLGNSTPAGVAVGRVVQYTATNADVFPSLGRPLTGGSTVTTQIIPPGQFYGERITQLDLRFARPFQVGKTKLTPSVDVFNVSNGNAVQQEIGIRVLRTAARHQPGALCENSA